MRIIKTSDSQFEAEFLRIKGRGKILDKDLEAVVRGILDDVALHGDKALFEYVEKLDGLSLDKQSFEVLPEEMEQALDSLDSSRRDILETAARRIEDFHRRQLTDSWYYSDEEGIELGQSVNPLQRVGIYAPGGLAFYPSTILMAAIPAKVAGVREVYVATPAKGERLDALILASAKLGGVKRIFRMGGAQAVAALAYGTQSVPGVDKIVGPGNAYVAAAKRMVYGVVGIDMIAGPSEVLIISDGKIDPSWVAADLLSQAEHDETAGAILLTPEPRFAQEVAEEVDKQLAHLSRSSIASRAIEAYGAVVVTKDMEESFELADRFAPEHLELLIERPKDFLGRIRNAGTVFLGPFTPEAIGDYLAGPNHVLPTGGTARFSSPLGVYDFLTRTNVVSFSPSAFARYGEKAAGFARIEGLEAHEKSVLKRLQEKKLDKSLK